MRDIVAAGVRGLRLLIAQPRRLQQQLRGVQGHALVDVAEAAVETAKENLEKSRDLARSDLMKTWQDARASFERLKRYDDSLLAVAKKSSDAAEFAFRHGALGVMDVLDARRTYRAIQLDALTVRADYAKSLAAWQATILESTLQ